MTTTEEALRAALRRLVIATVVVYAALAGLGTYTFADSRSQSADLSETIETTNRALCSLRADLARRVENSEEFLQEHPDGIPGIPAPTIQRGIDSQRATIAALAGLPCPVPP